MKRFHMVIILVASLVVLSPLAMFAPTVNASEPMVIMDGNQLVFDVPPIIQNGRTLVPMRGIFEALGAIIAWDDDTKTVTAGKGDTAVAVQIGNPYANVNDSPFLLDTPPQVVNGRTMVPLRFVSEAFGCEVSWNQQTDTITISSNGTPIENNNTSNNETSRLIGSWSSLVSSPSGTLVDPVTGFAEGSYYSGEWYFFKPDGTCRYVIIGKGIIISGISELLSNYQVEGNQIIFTNQIENFRPFPNDTRHTAVENKPVADETHTFIYNSADDTLNIDGVTTFYRINS